MFNSTQHYPTACMLLCFALGVGSASALDVVVDYTYDTNGFFAAPERRMAIEAVAARYSRVITSELTAVEPVLDLDGPTPWRFAFVHPATGGGQEISTASDAAGDPLVDQGAAAADVYGFPGLQQNEWIMFVGGRSMQNLGEGGTSTGSNFFTVYDDLDGPLHRGVIANTPARTERDLVAWGGAVAFNEDVNWHFDVATSAAAGTTDFYSIALHEVAHALGLASATWNQLTRYIDDAQYDGPNAVAALNRDNDTNESLLELESPFDNHWLGGEYQSKIYQVGKPNLVGTVGDGLQALLLEPQIDPDPAVPRFELTNVDVAALVDLGWSILEDLNADGIIDAADVDLACSARLSLAPYFEELGSLRGDIDFSGEIGFADFLLLSTNFDTLATYTQGDLDCSGDVRFNDFLMLSSSFGATSLAASVPEPSSSTAARLLLCVLLGFRLMNRRPAHGES